MVSENWQLQAGGLAEIMETAKTSFMQWNEQEFGNIFQKKKICKARLLGVQQKLAISPLRPLEKLELKLTLNRMTYWTRRNCIGNRRPDTNGLHKRRGIRVSSMKV